MPTRLYGPRMFCRWSGEFMNAVSSSATLAPLPMFSRTTVHAGTFAVTSDFKFGLCWNTPVPAIQFAQLLATLDAHGSYWSEPRPLSARDWFVAWNSSYSSGALCAEAGLSGHADRDGSDEEERDNDRNDPAIGTLSSCQHPHVGHVDPSPRCPRTSRQQPRDATSHRRAACDRVQARDRDRTDATYPVPIPNVRQPEGGLPADSGPSRAGRPPVGSAGIEPPT